MANRLEPGFLKADSQNLPKIDMFMVCEFIRVSDKFNAAEIRNAKAAMSTRECYGDQAIGYVCLRRDRHICTVKCRVCPEHRVRNQGYSVTLTVDEENEKIITVECRDCAAASGGCKHAIAFLMWIHRRSEHPSVTEIECYWRRSALASVGTAKKYVQCHEMIAASSIAGSIPSNSTFLQAFVKTAEEKQLDSQLSRHHFELKNRKVVSLSIHQLLTKFIENDGKSADDFIAFATKAMPQDLCGIGEKSTRGQSDTLLWHELRYGRITASKIYEAAQCKTKDGSFIQQVIGAAKVFDTKQMQRGRLLESAVLQEASKQTGLVFRNCGLQLVPSFPILGASPDAIGDGFIVEVKCPSTAKTFENFLPHGKISEKCKAQMHLQMFVTGKRKGIFCVADPNFESTQKITVLWESFDEKYINEIIEKATTFWKENIFTKMFNNLCD